MRKIALILFLVIFSCSKDKDVEEEVVIYYSLSITSAEGGTANDSAGLYESGTKVSVIANPSEGYLVFCKNDLNYNVLGFKITDIL